MKTKKKGGFKKLIKKISNKVGQFVDDYGWTEKDLKKQKLI